jgi:RNA polymerase subunit RPABC4/transcription elongation factor Spt4
MTTSIAVCKKCGRPLQVGESELCPSCAAQDAEKKGGWIKAVVAALTAVGSILVAVILVVIKIVIGRDKS